MGSILCVVSNELEPGQIPRIKIGHNPPPLSLTHLSQSSPYLCPSIINTSQFQSELGPHPGGGALSALRNPPPSNWKKNCILYDKERFNPTNSESTEKCVQIFFGLPNCLISKIYKIASQRNMIHVMNITMCSMCQTQYSSILF